MRRSDPVIGDIVGWVEAQGATLAGNGHGLTDAIGLRAAGASLDLPVEMATTGSQMTQGSADAPYSFRGMPGLQGWDEAKTLIIFDGVCVLCSGFAQFVLARDPERRVLFALAQSDFGEALYRHYDLKSSDYETNLVIADGRLFVKTRAFARVMTTLGWPWRAFALIRLIPAPIADWLYDRVARNRYRIFGRHDVCLLPDPDMQSRMIEGDARPAPAD